MILIFKSFQNEKKIIEVVNNMYKVICKGLTKNV